MNTVSRLLSIACLCLTVAMLTAGCGSSSTEIVTGEEATSAADAQRAFAEQTASESENAP